MDKVFVVPEFIGGSYPKDPVGPYFRRANKDDPTTPCAAQALAGFLASGDRYCDYTNPIRSLLLRHRNISHEESSRVIWEMIDKNDAAVSNAERRENLINFLRTYFPECEVK
jgi:hypothetical protein